MEKGRLLTYLEFVLIPDRPEIDPRYRGKELPVRFDYEKNEATVRKVSLTGKTGEWARGHFKQYT